MPNMPNKITDFDLSQILLNLHKYECECTTQDVLECSTPELRQELTQLLQQNLQVQYQLYQYMNQKGFYKPLPASQQELQAAQQQLQKAQQQIGGAYPGAGLAGGAGQAGVQQART